jgi:hypothetical protein
VYLSFDSLAHIAKEHPDVTDFDLLHIPLAIRFGLIVREISAPDRLMISYLPKGGTRRYKCVLKAAAGTTEVWVLTFHKMRQRQTQAMLRRGSILRRHKVWW